MTLILDATPLVALADSTEPQREALLETLRAEPGSLIVPAPVTAEVDYLLGERFGSPARRAFLSDLAARRYDVDALKLDDYPVAQDIELRYADLDLGLADCSIVVLAARHETRRLFSFDEHHFRTVEPMRGGTFELLPADA